VSFEDEARKEAWLQDLIHRFPQVLPVLEIEPAFGDLVPVCRELPTSVGSIDNLYIKRDVPAVSAALDQFEEKAKDLGVVVEAAPKSLQIRWTGPDEVDYALGGIAPDGTLRTMSINYKPNQLGKVDLAHEYLDKIATLMGSKVLPGEHPKGWRLGGNKGERPPAIDLLSRSDQWLEIIRWYTSELSSAIDEMSK
jgi:hypothetical protein